jgi:hypothetical protein
VGSCTGLPRASAPVATGSGGEPDGRVAASWLGHASVCRTAHEMGEGGVAAMQFFLVWWASRRVHAPSVAGGVTARSFILASAKPRFSAGSAVGVRNAQKGELEVVHIVHTLGLGLGRTSVGLARIRYVFGSSQCLQGRECGSSPTSGTVFSLFRGF